MHMDIAVYKCISHERLEKLKQETYGNQLFNKKYRTVKWKMNVSMLLHVFL